MKYLLSPLEQTDHVALFTNLSSSLRPSYHRASNISSNNAKYFGKQTVAFASPEIPSQVGSHKGRKPKRVKPKVYCQSRGFLYFILDR